MATVTHGEPLAVSPRIEEKLHRGELTYGDFARQVRQIDEQYQTSARLNPRQHN